MNYFENKFSNKYSRSGSLDIARNVSNTNLYYDFFAAPFSIILYLFMQKLQTIELLKKISTKLKICVLSKEQWTRLFCFVYT